ncbi:MAG: outer membrane lipoprotein chaperone LolA [Proteobacteria bacterium]|jgi:outer membrane lipoprotein carrier protein|nr:outer membrane lipoprotein chaperone LolA [Pseudomonadota bacterium]MDA1302351.1 outer membrane lipoprotein chaperone LolA [Pseudomonadota bacterium]
MAVLPLMLVAEPLALHEALSTINTLQADFTQTSQATEPQRGHLWMSKPDRFRIEISEPWRQTLVSNGHVFWNYDLDLEQVIVDDLDRDLRQLPILLFSSTRAELEEAFSVEHFEDGTATWYVLQPRAGTNLFRAMTLVWQDGLPSSLIIVDATDLRTEVQFHEVIGNENISEARFELEIPVAVDVVDQRSPAPGLVP